MSSEAASQLATVLAVSGFPLTAIVLALMCWYGARHQTWTPGRGWGPWPRGGARCGGADVIYESEDQKIRGVIARARAGEHVGALDVRALVAGDLALLEAELRDRLAAEAEDAQAAGPGGGTIVYRDGSSVFCWTAEELRRELRTRRRLIASITDVDGETYRFPGGEANDC